MPGLYGPAHGLLRADVHAGKLAELVVGVVVRWLVRAVRLSCVPVGPGLLQFERGLLMPGLRELLLMLSSAARGDRERLRAALPPGPPGGLLETLQFLRTPYSFFAEQARRYGDPFTVRGISGPIVVTGDPDLVRVIFGAEAASIEPFGVGVLAPFLGEHSLVLSAGERHRRDRKLLTPPFHGARMRAYGRTIVDATRVQTRGWRRGWLGPVQATTGAISLDIIVRAVFGIEDASARERWSDAIRTNVRSVTPAIIFLGALRRDFFGFGPWARFQRARERLDKLIMNEIATRRARGADGEDILSLMISARYDDGTSMTDAEIRDQLLTLLTAGHETTATALAWALYWIHWDPVLLRDLRGEIRALGASPDPDALAALELLDATCAEALRLHPIIPDVARRLRVPMTLGRWTLPTGVGVAVATTLLHADPKIYPHPERFDPRRFLKGPKPSPFAYTPFGGGGRRCLGAAFAMYEMKIVLATLLADWELELVDRDVAPVRQNVTVGPRGGVRMRVLHSRAA